MNIIVTIATMNLKNWSVSQVPIKIRNARFAWARTPAEKYPKSLPLAPAVHPVQARPGAGAVRGGGLAERVR